MGFGHSQDVLVDTNAVIEAYRCGCWAPLSQYFRLHTVEQVVLETQTGAQNRDPEENINEAELRRTLYCVSKVLDESRASFHAAFPAAILDPGERDLIVYAGQFETSDVWLLNSPDNAVVRHAHERGWLDRLVSLEAMTSHLKLRLNHPLRGNFCEAWLSSKRTKYVLGL